MHLRQYLEETGWKDSSRSRYASYFHLGAVTVVIDEEDMTVVYFNDRCVSVERAARLLLEIEETNKWH
jgi:hypothetical protein